MRLADNNLDGVERRLRAPGSQQAKAEELLAELVRLVESSELTSKRLRPPAGTVTESIRTDTEPMQRLEITSLRPSVEAPSGEPSETRVVDVEPQRAPESDNSFSNNPNQTELATERRAGASKFSVSALVLVSAAVVGSIFWLKRVEPGPPNASSLMETTQGPTAMQPRSNLTVATSSEAGATLKDTPQPAKVASPEARPIDLNVGVSPNNPPQSDLARTVIGASQPDPSDGKPVAASVNTSAVAAPIVAPQPVASQSLDPKPAHTVSLPPELDADRDANPLDPRTRARRCIQPMRHCAPQRMRHCRPSGPHRSLRSRRLVSRISRRPNSICLPSFQVSPTPASWSPRLMRPAPRLPRSGASHRGVKHP